MAISRVPGYSLLANLDRQGTDIGITSSGLYVTYWDVVNYRFGVNNSAPEQELDVTGNILTSNGHVYTNANISFDIGSTTNWWRTIYVNTITSTNLYGILQTNAQPNITSVGNLSVLNVTGNLSVDGNLIVNGVTVGNLSANNITANITGNLTGYVLQGDQPFITNLGDITVSNITITGGNLIIDGNVNFDTINAGNVYQDGNKVLDTSSNLQINGDVVGYGVYNNINVALVTTGVTAGTYGSDGQTVQLGFDNKGRVLTASNIALTKIGNLNFSNTTISSVTDLTISTTTNGNIYLDAGSTGIVQIVGSDAIGLPSGDDTTRPLNPNVGYTRYNTDRQSIEYYDGNSWLSPGEAVISSQTINPDGAANTFALSSNTTTAGVLVSINGTLQQPINAYTIVNNNQIQFTEIPLTTDIVEVRYISVNAVSVGSLQFQNTTFVTLDAQSINIVGNIQTTGFYNNLANNLLPNVATTTIDSYNIASYRTAKYIIQAVRSSDVQSSETLVTHNNSTALSTTYGVITIGNSLGNVSATIVGSNVEVQFTPTSANTYLTVSRDFYPL
jgi:hypothetical protein